MKKILKLSYIIPSFWWKRKLGINSSQWKILRADILKRDNYGCFFCRVKASKYMIIDHISGDATDNRKENLRVLCPMCDTIRHSGLASIDKTLVVRCSKISQLKIVEKTRKFFLEKGRVPSPEEIDPDSTITNFLPIDVAVVEEKQTPEAWKEYKGFFTENFFLKKVTSKFLNYLI